MYLLLLLAALCSTLLLRTDGYILRFLRADPSRTRSSSPIVTRYLWEGGKSYLFVSSRYRKDIWEFKSFFFPYRHRYSWVKKKKKNKNNTNRFIVSFELPDISLNPPAFSPLFFASLICCCVCGKLLSEIQGSRNSLRLEIRECIYVDLSGSPPLLFVIFFVLRCLYPT